MEVIYLAPPLPSKERRLVEFYNKAHLAAAKVFKELQKELDKPYGRCEPDER